MPAGPWRRCWSSLTFLVFSITLSMSSSLPVHRWTSPLLRQASDATTFGVPKKQALVILNQPLIDTDLLRRLWVESNFRICADGGANRVHELGPAFEEACGLPQAIRGDLDSLTPTVRKYYQGRGVTIEQDPDQDSNDLTKCLTMCYDDDKQPLYDRVVVYGAFGGRFDQEMASMQSLYQYPNLWLYSHETCAFLLPANVRNEIRLVHGVRNDFAPYECGEGPTCGLIPLSMPCESVTTTGFRWNLTNHSTHFGGLVSSSNHIDDETVTVVCSHPLIFTAEVHTSPTMGE